MVLAAVEEEQVSSDARGASYGGKENRHLGVPEEEYLKEENMLTMYMSKNPSTDKCPDLCVTEKWLTEKWGLGARSCGFDESVFATTGD
jgi:hypothetical protein